MKIVLSIVIFVFLTGCTFFSDNPKVSVILLTYNRQDMLPAALDSILQQTYQNFELIVINDGSKDNTEQILREYAQKDKRIIVINNKKNQGIVANRNMGILLAKGKYIAWQDDDDVSDVRRLEEQVKYLEKHKDIVILGTQISFLGTERMLYLWPTEVDPKKAEIAFLIGRLPVVLASAMWRRDFFVKHKIFFDENIPLVEDFVIYDAVLKYGGKIMTLNKILYQYRLHQSNERKYYGKLKEIQNSVYEARWKSFFGDVTYPKTSCKRLKYVKEHNSHFDSKLLDSMYARHCKGKVFYPTYIYQEIVHDDGEAEPITVSLNDAKFFSNKLRKGGRVIKIDKGLIEILWDDKKQSQVYKLYENNGGVE